MPILFDVAHQLPTSRDEDSRQSRKEMWCSANPPFGSLHHDDLIKIIQEFTHHELSEEGVEAVMFSLVSTIQRNGPIDSLEDPGSDISIIYSEFRRFLISLKLYCNSKLVLQTNEENPRISAKQFRMLLSVLREFDVDSNQNVKSVYTSLMKQGVRLKSFLSWALSQIDEAHKSDKSNHLLNLTETCDLLPVGFNQEDYNVRKRMYNIADPDQTGCIKYSQAEFTISVYLGETIPDLRVAIRTAFRVASGGKRGPDATIEFEEYFTFLLCVKKYLSLCELFDVWVLTRETWIPIHEIAELEASLSNIMQIAFEEIAQQLKHISEHGKVEFQKFAHIALKTSLVHMFQTMTSSDQAVSPDKRQPHDPEYVFSKREPSVRLKGMVEEPIDSGSHRTANSIQSSGIISLESLSRTPDPPRRGITETLKIEDFPSIPPGNASSGPPSLPSEHAEDYSTPHMHIESIRIPPFQDTLEWDELKFPMNLEDSKMQLLYLQDRLANAQALLHGDSDYSPTQPVSQHGWADTDEFQMNKPLRAIPTSPTSRGDHFVHPSFSIDEVQDAEHDEQMHITVYDLSLPEASSTFQIPNRGKTPESMEEYSSRQTVSQLKQASVPPLEKIASTIQSRAFEDVEKIIFHSIRDFRIQQTERFMPPRWPSPETEFDDSSMEMHSCLTSRRPSFPPLARQTQHTLQHNLSFYLSSDLLTIPKRSSSPLPIPRTSAKDARDIQSSMQMITQQEQQVLAPSPLLEKRLDKMEAILKSELVPDIIEALNKIYQTTLNEQVAEKLEAKLDRRSDSISKKVEDLRNKLEEKSSQLETFLRQRAIDKVEMFDAGDEFEYEERANSPVVTFEVDDIDEQEGEELFQNQPDVSDSSSDEADDSVLKTPRLDVEEDRIRMLEPRFSQQDILGLANRSFNNNSLEVVQDNRAIFARRGSWQHNGEDTFLNRLPGKTKTTHTTTLSTPQIQNLYSSHQKGDGAAKPRELQVQEDRIQAMQVVNSNVVKYARKGSWEYDEEEEQFPKQAEGEKESIVLPLIIISQDTLPKERKNRNDSLLVTKGIQEDEINNIRLATVQELSEADLSAGDKPKSKKKKRSKAKKQPDNDQTQESDHWVYDLVTKYEEDSQPGILTTYERNSTVEEGSEAPEETNPDETSYDGIDDTREISSDFSENIEVEKKENSLELQKTVQAVTQEKLDLKESAHPASEKINELISGIRDLIDPLNAAPKSAARLTTNIQSPHSNNNEYVATQIKSLRDDVDKLCTNVGLSKHRDAKKVGFSPRHDIMEYAPHKITPQSPLEDVGNTGGASFEDVDFSSTYQSPMHLTSEERNDIQNFYQNYDENDLEARDVVEKPYNIPDFSNMSRPSTSLSTTSKYSIDEREREEAAFLHEKESHEYRAHTASPQERKFQQQHQASDRNFPTVPQRTREHERSVRARTYSPRDDLWQRRSKRTRDHVSYSSSGRSRMRYDPSVLLGRTDLGKAEECASEDYWSRPVRRRRFHSDAELRPRTYKRRSRYYSEDYDETPDPYMYDRDLHSYRQGGSAEVRMISQDGSEPMMMRDRHGIYYRNRKRVISPYRKPSPSRTRSPISPQKKNGVQFRVRARKIPSNKNLRLQTKRIREETRSRSPLLEKGKKHHASQRQQLVRRSNPHEYKIHPVQDDDYVGLNHGFE